MRKKLLPEGILSDEISYRDLLPMTEMKKEIHAILYVAERPSATLLSAFECMKKRFPQIAQGLVLSEADTLSFPDASRFAFVLHDGVRAKVLAEKIVIAIIEHAGINPTDRIAGALRYRYPPCRFSIIMQKFSFSVTHTALLLRLMEVFPGGADRDDLMYYAFLPLGRKSPSNVSHAVSSINEKIVGSGHRPLIEISDTNRYFLR